MAKRQPQRVEHCSAKSRSRAGQAADGGIGLVISLAATFSACAAARTPAPPLAAPPKPAALPAPAPPPLFLLDVRPGFAAAGQPRSSAQQDVRNWFEAAVGGLAAATFIRPIIRPGYALITDGVAYGRISSDRLTWAPELSCGLDPVNRSWSFWGRDPNLFTIAHDGFVRFDSGRRRWINVGPDPTSWPDSLPPTVTEMPDGRTLLVLWLARRHLVLIGEAVNPGPARQEPTKLPLGFYQLADSLTPVGLALRQELTDQTVIDLRVTRAGDVVLLSSAGADIWPAGRTQSISAPVFAHVSPEPFPETRNWIDVDGSRPPEIIHRSTADRSAITHFDGHVWTESSMPLSGPISAWARDGSARLYAEATPDGARIWRRTQDDHWTQIDELPGGAVKTLASDGAGAIWAFVPVAGSPTGELWYSPRAGEHVRVRLPGEHAKLGISGFSSSDSIVWVTAMGNDMTMEIFATREFRQSGERVRPGDDPCSRTP